MPYASRWIATSGAGVTWFRAVSLGALIVTGLVVPLAGCATSGTGQATPSATASPSATPTPGTTTPPPSDQPLTNTGGPPDTGQAMSRVVVARSGGIAGVMQVLTVDTNGSWTYADKRRGTSQTGHLSSGQRQQLAGLVTSSNFVREARMSPMGTCNDAFVYSITVGSMTARFDDCDNAGRQPTMAAVINLMVDATPM
jgi:VCBS repeat-containing protein